MSLTYKDIMIRLISMHLTKRAESWLLKTKPREEITIENFSNQAWGACLRSYNDFLSFQTYSESCEILKGAPYKHLHEDLHSRRYF
jgi:hypothetical protein